MFFGGACQTSGLFANMQWYACISTKLPRSCPHCFQEEWGLGCKEKASQTYYLQARRTSAMTREVAASVTFQAVFVHVSSTLIYHIWYVHNDSCIGTCRMQVVRMKAFMVDVCWILDAHRLLGITTSEREVHAGR